MKEIETGWCTTVAKVDCQVHVLVHEAANLRASDRVVLLCEEAVSRYYPDAVDCIDWTARTFAFPVRLSHLRSRPEWVLAFAPADTLTMYSYLSHALLAAGFTGNGHYEVHVAAPGSARAAAYLRDPSEARRLVWSPLGSEADGGRF